MGAGFPQSGARSYKGVLAEEQHGQVFALGRYRYVQSVDWTGQGWRSVLMSHQGDSQPAEEVDPVPDH